MTGKPIEQAKHFLKPALAVLGLAIIVIWTTGVWRTRIAPDTVPHEPGRPLPDAYESVEAQKEILPVQVRLVGSVASDNQVELSARVHAYIAEIKASAGDTVTRDQQLIRLDDRDLQTQLTSAHAELRRTQSEYERIQRLYDTQASTEQELISARTAFELARAKAEQAEVLLSFSVIRSPMDGQVTDRHVERGQLVQPGQPLLKVYDPAVMRLDVSVPVRLMDYVSLGDRFAVQLESPNIEVEGIVHRIVSGIEPRSRTQTIQLLLDTEYPVLPGTFGRLAIPTRERAAVRLPVDAVYRVGQLEMVDVVRNGRAIRRLVTTGPVYDHWIEILSGLSDGEEVITSGTQR